MGATTDQSTTTVVRILGSSVIPTDAMTRTTLGTPTPEGHYGPYDPFRAKVARVEYHESLGLATFSRHGRFASRK